MFTQKGQFVSVYSVSPLTRSRSATKIIRLSRKTFQVNRRSTDAEPRKAMHTKEFLFQIESISSCSNLSLN